MTPAASDAAARSRLGRCVRAVGSAECAIVLLAVLAVAAAGGTVWPQQMPPAAYTKAYGATWGDWIVRAGLDDIYHAGWFVGLLGLLALSVAAGVAIRVAERAVTATFLANHGAVLLILAGGAIDLMGGVDGYIRLTRTVSADGVIDWRERAHPFGFRLALQELAVVHAPEPVAVLGFHSVDPAAQQQVVLGPGDAYDLPAGFHVRLVRRVSEFSTLPDARAIVAGREPPRGPALLAEVSFPDGRREERWLFGAVPDLDVNQGADRRVALSYALRFAVRDQIARIQLVGAADGAEPVTGEVRANAPFRYAGWTFTHADFDEAHRQWCILRVTREPGAPLVALGIGVLLLGLGVRLGGALAAARGGPRG